MTLDDTMSLRGGADQDSRGPHPARRLASRSDPHIVSTTPDEQFVDGPLLERVIDLRDRLRPSEQKVADVVIDAPSKALSANMAQLATLADVSEPTVMRFCLAVGAGSFQDFKLRLAQSLALGLPPTQSAIRTDDTTAELVAKVFDHTITSLDRARRDVSPTAIGRAIDALAVAQSIVFIGFGASGIVAMDAQQKFPLFGVPCDAHTDGHQQFMSASLSGPHTAFVAISNTGRTRGVVEAARIARARGATVIGITGENGPLLDVATIPIRAATFEDTDVFTPTTSRLAALAIVDILATGVAMRQPPSRMTQLREMKAGLSRLRSGDDVT